MVGTQELWQEGKLGRLKKRAIIEESTNPCWKSGYNVVIRQKVFKESMQIDFENPMLPTYVSFNWHLSDTYSICVTKYIIIIIIITYLSLLWQE
jgi:hypothetical protein